MTEDTIFFSYSRKDSEFVKQLALKLRKAGANIWLDQLDIKPSMHWDNTIEKALESCNTMLVILTKTSVKSENVKDEYSYAIEKNKRVVPILLEECEIPFRLRRLQYADFSNDSVLGMKTLTETLKFDHEIVEKLTNSSIKIPLTANQKAIKDEKDKSKIAYILLGIVLVVVVILGVFWSSIFPSSAKETSSLTVLVHEESRKDKLVLPNRGQVKLIFGDAIVIETINAKGEATFKQIPSSFFDENASVEIHFSDPEGEPYRAVFPDSIYNLSQVNYISLAVKLFGLGEISGVIRDFKTGDPVEGVRVSIAGIEAFSNSYGEYQLSIPVDKQKKFQTVRAFKEGYQMYEMKDVPIQTNDELPIKIKPKIE